MVCKSLSFGKIAHLDLKGPTNKAFTKTFGCVSHSAVLLWKVCSFFHINYDMIHPWISERFLGSSDTRKDSTDYKGQTKEPSTRHLSWCFGMRSPTTALETGHISVLWNYNFSLLPILYMRNLRCLVGPLEKKVGHILRITYLSGYSREIQKIWVLFSLFQPCSRHVDADFKSHWATLSPEVQTWTPIVFQWIPVDSNIGQDGDTYWDTQENSKVSSGWDSYGGEKKQKFMPPHVICLDS